MIHFFFFFFSTLKFGQSKIPNIFSSLLLHLSWISSMSKSNPMFVSPIIIILLISTSTFASPDLVLNQRTSRRPDPLSRFKSYNGVYDIRNKHYWAVSMHFLKKWNLIVPKFNQNVHFFAFLEFPSLQYLQASMATQLPGFGWFLDWVSVFTSP